MGAEENMTVTSEQATERKNVSAMTNLWNQEKEN